MKEKADTRSTAARLTEEILAEAEILDESVRIAGMALDAAEQCGLSRREIAKRMGMTSPSTVQRLVRETESGNPRLETLLRFARATGYRLKIEFVPAMDFQAEHGCLAETEAKPEKQKIAVHWPDEWPGSVERAERSTVRKMGTVIPFPISERQNTEWHNPAESKEACKLSA